MPWKLARPSWTTGSRTQKNRHPYCIRTWPRSTASGSRPLRDEDGKAEAAEVFRTLVDQVTLVPDADELAIVLGGDLAAILTFAAGKKSPTSFRRPGFLAIWYRQYRWLRGGATTDADTRSRSLFSSSMAQYSTKSSPITTSAVLNPVEHDESAVVGTRCFDPDTHLARPELEPTFHQPDRTPA